MRESKPPATHNICSNCDNMVRFRSLSSTVECDLDPQEPEALAIFYLGLQESVFAVVLSSWSTTEALLDPLPFMYSIGMKF